MASGEFHIDRLIHSTTLPFYRVCEEVLGEFQNMMDGLIPFLSRRKTLVLLSDHGFSEKAGTRFPRYGHDPARVADTLAVCAVLEKTNEQMF